MRKLLLSLLIIAVLIGNASATEYTAPPAPDSVQDLMPVETESFGEGLWKIIQNAVSGLYPTMIDAAKICLSFIAITMLISIMKPFPSGTLNVVALVGVLAVSGVFLSGTKTMISLGVDTVAQLSDYGKLILPVMTAALASQGGVTTSAALYTGTAAFNALLSSLISKLLIPLIYLSLAITIAAAATNEDMLNKLRNFIKWLMSWILKIILYVFTGYMGITGVISGTADASALKAAKLTISGVVPMVGGILSDASEAVIVGAGVMKNTVGIYGLFAIIAIWIFPFLQLGVHYLLMKATTAICAVFDIKSLNLVLEQFTSVMGLLLGMTGSVCLLLLISMVCFMKGVG